MKHIRTEREFHIALGKLLDRVRNQNNWSIDSFREAARHVANIIPSEGERFQKAMMELNLIVPGNNRKSLQPNFDIIIWRNDDRKISFVRDILEMFPDIVQKRGRRSISVMMGDVEDKLPVMQQEDIDPLDSYPSVVFVAKLRERGYEVICRRQVITIEEL